MFHDYSQSKGQHYRLIIRDTSSRVFSHYKFYASVILISNTEAITLIEQSTHMINDQRLLLSYSCQTNIMEYTACVWDPYQKYLTDNIEKIQRRAAR